MAEAHTVADFMACVFATTKRNRITLSTLLVLLRREVLSEIFFLIVFFFTARGDVPL